jgi:hypothetical protein
LLPCYAPIEWHAGCPQSTMTYRGMGSEVLVAPWMPAM